MPDLPKQPTPKIDALERLLKIFTVEQIGEALDELEEVKAHGFGEVAITFHHHKPQKLQATIYKVLSYTPE